MTDTHVSEVALVTPVSSDAIPQVNQAAYITLVTEVPPVAGSVHNNVIAFVCVDVEFSVPVTIQPLSIGQFLQTMPYYIGDFD